MFSCRRLELPVMGVIQRIRHNIRNRDNQKERLRPAMLKKDTPIANR